MKHREMKTSEREYHCAKGLEGKPSTLCCVEHFPAGYNKEFQNAGFKEEIRDRITTVYKH